MKRIKEEQRVVEQMIRLYCRKKEGNKELCPGCQELLQYATARLERCKFGENKPTCKKCPIHCYRPQMKERMCKVGDYILKVNNIAKTSTQTNTQKRST